MLVFDGELFTERDLADENNIIDAIINAENATANLNQIL